LCPHPTPPRFGSPATRAFGLILGVPMIDAPEDPFDLILRYLPDWTPTVIFDVGANVGQSAKAYARRFPETQIHSFEPSPQTCEILTEKMERFPNVAIHCLALGRAKARLALTQGKNSAMNRLLPADTSFPKGAVWVDVVRGADVMRDLKIDHIDYLKIDTEGHDLAVLQGFLDRLDHVDFIQVEAGMNSYNTTHVPFGQMDTLLKEEGFHLAHIFEQKMEWKRGGQPVLRRCNPLYVNRRLADLSGIG
jgi:FkbM family methyltransferase